jgi:MFS family permease
MGSATPDHAEDFRMTPVERNASIWLALLYGSRMLGMFLILPVFAVHAAGLPGGGDAWLVGLAFGVYGLTQALFQIPFGVASDRFGRKPVITAGLLLMLAGSLIAAASDTLVGLAAGRALQGAGAVSAAISALLADSTRDSQRTKAMAMVGGMIGLSFAVSLVVAPVLYRAVGLSGIFILTAVLAVAGIVIVWRLVPSPGPSATVATAPASDAPAMPEAEAGRGDVREVGAVAAAAAAPAAASAAAGQAQVPPAAAMRKVLDPDMMRLNVGIFVLHLTQMALFVVVPARLVNQVGLPLSEHWKIYLPVVVASFAVMMPPLNWAERSGQLRGLFLFAIGMLLVSQLGFGLVQPGLGSLSVFLLLFFLSFNMLEALMPSLVSRLAPVQNRGLAMGVFSTTQALGVLPAERWADS